MPRLLLAAVVLAILAQCASARTRAAPSPIASPGRFDDDYDEDDGFDLDEDAFVFVADEEENNDAVAAARDCLLYTSPSPRDLSTSRMPSSA